MAAAIIKFVQGVNTPPADEALEGVTGVAVVCTNDDNAGIVTWSWRLVDSPPGSSNTPGIISTVSSASFTPDIPGGYLIELTTIDGSANAYTDSLAVLVPEDAVYNRIIPPFSAAATALNIGGQTRGWAPFIEDYLHVIDRIGDWSSSAPSNTDVPTWDSSLHVWKPLARTAIFTPGGDLSGSATAQKVVGISNVPTASSMNAPSDGVFIQKLSGAWAAISAAVLSAAIVIASLPPGSNGQVLTTTGGVTGWAALPSSGITALTGDVTASGSGSVAATVVKINGATVPAAGSLTTGNVLQVTGSSALSYAAINLAGGANFVTGTLPAGNQAAQTMGGDVTGTTAAAVVAKVNGSTVPAGGSLTTGNVLQVTGAGALSYAAINLAGGANFVSGVLPTGNQAAQSMSGDVSGTTASATVAKINGATVPAAGSLTTGNSLHVSGSSALSYSALNLAGGSGWVTGQLPVANLANGTAAQVLVTNSGATAPAWVSLSGDVSITAAGATTVASIQGITISGTPATGNVLIATSTSAAHWAAPSSFAAGGDLAGSSSSQTVSTLTATTQRAKTSNYTIDASGTDFLVLCDTSGGSFTITLPTPAAGRVFILKDATGAFGINFLSITRHASEKIDGVAQDITLFVRDAEVIFTCDGTDWTTNAITGGRLFRDGGISYWSGSTNGAGTISGQFGFLPAVQSSSSQVTPTSTSLLTSVRRLKCSASSNGSALGIIDNTIQNCWRGNAAGRGGFRMLWRICFEQAGSAGTLNMLAGLTESLSPGATTNWTTQTTVAEIGFGFNMVYTSSTLTGNWKFITSSGSGSPTVVDLGASFAINNTSLLEFEIWCYPNASTVYYRASDLTTGVTTLGSSTSTLPVSTKFLSAFCEMGLTTPTGTHNLTIARYLQETPS